MRKEFGERVRHLREQQRISQTTFASMIGMDRKYLNGIEQGKRNPSLDKIESIADGLDMSVSCLMRGICEPARQTAPGGTYEYYHLD